MDALITRPDYDKVTSYLSAWAYDIVQFAQQKGMKVADLHGAKANKKMFVSFISKKNPRFVMMNGHGTPDSVYGCGGEVLVKKDENEILLKNKIVYAIACHAASELGKSAVNTGSASAFIGYIQPFCFITNKNSECIPKEDKLANIFKEASNQVSVSLIKKNNVEMSYTNSQKKFRQLMKDQSASESLPGASEIRFWLFWDMQSQTFLGDPKASL